MRIHNPSCSRAKGGFSTSHFLLHNFCHPWPNNYTARLNHFPLCEITFNKDSDGTRLNFANELAQLGVLVLAVKNSFDLDDLLRHGLEFIRRLNKSCEWKTVHHSSHLKYWDVSCKSESIMERQRFCTKYGITSWKRSNFEKALCEVLPVKESLEASCGLWR